VDIALKTPSKLNVESRAKNRVKFITFLDEKTDRWQSQPAGKSSYTLDEH
tara:strand:+ start:613 stop:762 length:150 start_codon:yes stop_codon:yes gene_type:complete